MLIYFMSSCYGACPNQLNRPSTSSLPRLLLPFLSTLPTSSSVHLPPGPFVDLYVSPIALYAITLRYPVQSLHFSCVSSTSVLHSFYSADLSRELIVALKANLFRCQSLFLTTAGDRSTPLKLLSVSSVCPPQWCSLGETRCSHASRHHWVKSSRYRKWS